MPEIAEVARVVHYLRKHAVGRTIEAVKAQEDDIVFGKVGTSASAFQKAMAGKKILDARQQGKYFWLVMNSAPHPLMHLGMTGWIKFSNDDSAYYRPAKPEQAEWPPRFWKFVLQLKGDPKCEIAFVDPRRLARIRLVDVEADQMRMTTPLKENGPDPVIDKDVLTVEWLGQKLRSKKVPIKALLLNQANISGIGNWVADETMYQARLHPEQYSNTFSDEQIKRLHDAIMYVCDTAVGTLAESDKFPKDWLMKYRWDKGKKSGSQLPNGAKITFLTVGGRTSAIVPSVQKKTAAVAGDVSDGAESEGGGEEEEEEVKPKRAGKRKAKDLEEDTAPGAEAKAGGGGGRKTRATENNQDVKLSTKAKRGRKANEADIKEESGAENDEDEDEAPTAKKSKSAPAKKSKTAEGGAVKVEDTSGRRRSGRLAK